MGRALLVCRLAARDLRRRPAEAALLLLAIVAATTTLTLGLVLHGVISKPYQSTREATAGPDVVASVAPSPAGGAADLAGLDALSNARGVTGHSGPYLVIWTSLAAHGQTATAQVQGRDLTRASIDQPKLTQGSWVREGGAVVEAAFADALGVSAGDPISMNGRTFRVVGVAVTATTAPYPELSCLTFCPGAAGLVWLTRTDARSLAPQARSLSYVLNLKLADPSAAPAFVDAHNPDENAPPGTRPSDPKPEPPLLLAWQDISEASANLVRNQRKALLTGGWLLVMLAVASVAVLVGGRMADQIRRVGLLKAVGGTPSLVAAVLLAEYVVVALLAAAAGLALGRLAAPLLIDPSAGLLGRAGAPSLTTSTVGLVTAVALGVAIAATFVPAVRAARTSTVLALADSARAPRRTAWLITISARLPVPLLLGLRLSARRPRRVLLATVSIAITVSGIVAALAAHADLNESGASVLDPARADRLNQVLLMITITLVALAAVNAIVITWATALDARHASAVARALGSTPQQVSAGLSAAQLLPALVGAILGIPGGIALFAAVGDSTTLPPLWQLLAVVPATVLVVAGLTAIPARIGARRPVAEILQSELA
jgi:ABC-type lipoprotein release transport system permease subunit